MGSGVPQPVVIISGREPEGRVDPITGSGVIISAARSLREKKKLSGCPFCPGNEGETTLELISFRNDPLIESSWRVRGFTNLYPPLALEAKGGKSHENTALGVNEVIVETPQHNGFLSSLLVENIAEAFDAIVKRYFSLRGDPILEWFSVFKNFGKQAGASIEHPHFQIAVKASIPKKFRERFLLALEYFWNTGRCLCCDQITRHKNLGQIVLDTENFVMLVPHEARVPYHLRIFPKKHNPSFAHVLRDSERVRREFAWVLKHTVLLYKIAVQEEDHVNLSDPLYNFYIETAPYRDDGREGIFHWHLEFRGKTTTEAGYEQHTGEFVNPTYPEEVAQQLREIAANFIK